MPFDLDAPLHTDGRRLEEILARGEPTLVVFETADCAPCRALVPALETLAREYAGRVAIVRVEASEAWLAARYHLCYVPTLVFCVRGEEQARIKGNPGEGAVRAHLQFLLTGIDPPEPAVGSRHTLRLSFGSAPVHAAVRGILSEKARS